MHEEFIVKIITKGQPRSKFQGAALLLKCALNLQSLHFIKQITIITQKCAKVKLIRALHYFIAVRCINLVHQSAMNKPSLVNITRAK